MRGVILTKSAKHGGYCAAVYDIRNNRIVRLVRDEDGGSIPYFQLEKYHLLDAADFLVGDTVPRDNHTENILWKGHLIRLPRIRYRIEDIYARLYPYGSDGLVFGSAEPQLASVAGMGHSLQIFRVEDLFLHHKEGSKSGKADFVLNGIRHLNYSVTDYDNYSYWKDGKHMLFIGDAYIVVSLPRKPYIVGENQNLGYFKYVAAIYPCNT